VPPQAERPERSGAAFPPPSWVVAPPPSASQFPRIPRTPEAVALYLLFEADRGAKPSTIARRLAAIRYVHAISGHPNPTNDERVRAVIRSIRRTRGTAPRRVLPATVDRVLAMVPRPDGGLSTLRDRGRRCTMWTAPDRAIDAAARA
jgi:hypothetical protein